MSKVLRFLLVLGIVMGVVFSPIAYALAQGTVLADTGFRPQQHGFSFANYGNENKPVNLTPAAMQKVFGDRVCKAITATGCVLTATAQAWMDHKNNEMNGGHCEGMAALSKLIFTGQIKLADLDPNARSIQDLKPDNPRVQEEIARWFATQYVPPTATSEIKNQSPNQIVDTLIEQLKANTGPFTMGIYTPQMQQGHAITPYSVVDIGNGIVRVMVYDNNYPNQERFIEIDRNTNTWKYTGTTNPNEPVTEYTGNANTFNLTLTPATARLTQPQECNFCKPDDGGVGAAPNQNQAGGQPEANRASCGTSVSTGPDADLVVTDQGGNRAGVVNGQSFSEIPGAVVVQPRSQDTTSDTPGATVIVPGGQAITVTVNGAGGNDVLLTSCGGFQQVKGLSQADDEPDSFLFGANGKDVTLEVDPDEIVELKGGYDNPTGNDFSYDLTSVRAPNGGIIQVRADPETNEFNIQADTEISFVPSFSNIGLDGNTVQNSYAESKMTPNQSWRVNGDQAATNSAPEFLLETLDPGVLGAAKDNFLQSQAGSAEFYENALAGMEVLIDPSDEPEQLPPPDQEGSGSDTTGEDSGSDAGEDGSSDG